MNILIGFKYFKRTVPNPRKNIYTHIFRVHYMDKKNDSDHVKNYTGVLQNILET